MTFSKGLLTFTALQELNALSNDGVTDHDHVLGHVLNEGEEAALGIEPGVRAQLLVVGLQALYHTRNAKLVVPLRAVQCPDGERIVIKHLHLM